MDWASEHKDGALKLQILEGMLRNPREVIELANEYRRQGMQKEVVALLKKAHKDFPVNDEVINLLTEELQKSGGGEKALKLVWDAFTREPTRDKTLDRLQAAATKQKC